MNKQLMHKRVTIIGMARAGMALAREIEVVISDIRSAAELQKEIRHLSSWPIQCVLGGHPKEILETDVVYVSPGVPRHIPILREAQKRGIPLSSEIALFFELCQAPIIGITGSSGKTTTTTLIGEMMAQDLSRKVWVGGNIGRPLIEHVDKIAPYDWVVLELSSFQLEHLTRSPHIAVITNLRPNHLDRHPSYQAYIDAKTNILRYQSDQDPAIFNWDNPDSLAITHCQTLQDDVTQTAQIAIDEDIVLLSGTSFDAFRDYVTMKREENAFVS